MVDARPDLVVHACACIEMTTYVEIHNSVRGSNLNLGASSLVGHLQVSKDSLRYFCLRVEDRVVTADGFHAPHLSGLFNGRVRTHRPGASSANATSFLR